MNQLLTTFTAAPHPYLAEKHAFSSKERDVETGLSYFGARYYSSELSLWLSVDPMSGKYPSMSPYTYCANNPVKLVDPKGREWVTTEDATFAESLIDQAIERQSLYSPNSEEYKALQEGIDGLMAMCEDESQKYTFTESSTNEGFVSKQQDGTISINYVERPDIQDSKNGSAWHEVIHLTRRNAWKKQTEEERASASTTYWGFINNKLGNNNLCDEEYKAYASQLIFSPQSMPHNNGIKVGNLNAIQNYISKHYNKCDDDHNYQYPIP